MPLYSVTEASAVVLWQLSLVLQLRRYMITCLLMKEQSQPAARCTDLFFLTESINQLGWRDGYQIIPLQGASYPFSTHLFGYIFYC